MSTPFTTTNNPTECFDLAIWDEIIRGIVERTNTLLLGVPEYTSTTVEDGIAYVKESYLSDFTDISHKDAIGNLAGLLMFNSDSYYDAPGGAVSDPSSLSRLPLLYVGSASQADRDACQWMPRYRDKPPSLGGTLLTYGEQEVGDIFGPWIIDAFHRLLSRMRYCQCSQDMANNAGQFVASFQSLVVDGVPISQFVSGVSKRFYIYKAGVLVHTSDWTVHGFYTYTGTPLATYTAIVEFAATNSNI